jgi:hypothetical protein
MTDIPAMTAGIPKCSLRSDPIRAVIEPRI